MLEFYGFDHEKNKVEAYGKPDARVGVTSIPEYVSCDRFLLQVDEILILDDSIAHYTVSSLLIPFQPTKASGSANKRTHSASKEAHAHSKASLTLSVQPEELSMRPNTGILRKRRRRKSRLGWLETKERRCSGVLGR